MGEEADAIILPRTEDLVFWLFGLVPVIFLLLWDFPKAWKRGAPWIPGQPLVLSAIIIQSLSFIDYSHIRVYSGSRYQTKEDVVAILVKNQLVIDSGRVMMCVLIACLLPGMARSGSIMDGSNLAALALSIISDVVSELWSIWKVEKRNESLSALAASSFAIILIIAIIYLLVLLIKAVRSGRNSCRIRSLKVPSALSRCCTPCDRPSYNDIKDHVLKCWLAARLYQPDYVLVRTGLCSTAFTVVTVCIVVHVIKQIYLQFTDNESLNSVTKKTLVHSVIFGQCVIVLIGWIVLLVRWHGDIFSGDYFNSLSCRNAWHCVKKLFKNLSRQKPRRRRTSRGRTRVRDNVQFSMYEATLNMLLIPGETALSLWKANQRGFRKVERCMEQEEGKCSLSELTDLLRTGEGEEEVKAEHLQEANKNSWMRTTVSLIRFMIYSYNDSDASAIEHASVIEDAMQCYIKGWEYMNLVDGLKEEVKSLGPQADEEFDSLQHSWNKRAQPGRLEREIKQPLRQLRNRLESLSNEDRRNLQNSCDSTEVAKYCLFETWTAIDTYLSNPQINKIHRLQCLLARVYYSYMTQDLNKAVQQKCSKLAEEGMEEEILDVAILLAKAQRVLDKVGEGNDLENAVEPRHNTDQASTSSPIPTVKVGDGNDQYEPQSIRLRRVYELYNTDQTEIDVDEEENYPWDYPIKEKSPVEENYPWDDPKKEKTAWLTKTTTHRTQSKRN